MKRKAEEISAEEVVEEVPEKARSGYTNKQRLLILSSRGITARYRHLQEDLKLLIPHHKKDSKLDSKGDITSEPAHHTKVRMNIKNFAILQKKEIR